jgi:GNAT superfamily N-acetyltransferase
VIFVRFDVQSDAALSAVVPISPPTNYPSHLEKHVELPDGHCITLRPVVPEDATRMRRAFEVVDSETIRNRFFTGAAPSDDASIEYLVTVDYGRRLALVAMDAQGASIAIGRYEATDAPDAAEIAIVVAPDWRRRGVARVVLEALEAPAIANGYERFVALYLPDNKAIEALLTDLGYRNRKLDGGISTVQKALH